MKSTKILLRAMNKKTINWCRLKAVELFTTIRSLVSLFMLSSDPTCLAFSIHQSLLREWLHFVCMTNRRSPAKKVTNSKINSWWMVQTFGCKRKSLVWLGYAITADFLDLWCRWSFSAFSCCKISFGCSEHPWGKSFWLKACKFSMQSLG